MLGDNIRKIRKERKISINNLSKESGVSLGYLSDLENNRVNNPTLEKLRSIADVLKVTVEYLFKDELPLKDEAPKTEDDVFSFMSEEDRLLFKKIKTLSKKDAKKILDIIEVFEKENGN